MSSLLQALVGGVPTLVDAQSVARQMVADTNGTTALVAGNYITGQGGTIDKADAPTAKFALGYVLAAVAASAVFAYYTDGTNTGVTGMTKGNPVVLASAGAGSSTPLEPAGAGNGWQHLGFAVSTTAVAFAPGPGYTRA